MWTRRTFTRPYSSEEEPREPVVVCHAISKEDFLCWIGHDDSGLERFQFEPNLDGTGRVVVYEQRTAIHDEVSRAIIASIQVQLVKMVPDPTMLLSLCQPVSTVCDLGDRLQAPDDALVPANASKGRAPTLVIEVAYLGETVDNLHDRLSRWIERSPEVFVCIGIKVFSSVRRVAMLMQKYAPPQIVEFGGSWRRSNAPIALSFPMRLLFQGLSFPRSLFGRGDEPISIDLDSLRDVIHNAELKMKRQFY